MLVPYDEANSLSRYSNNSNWNKILFRPDRKLQITEVEEIQDMLYSQLTKGFNTLYDFYTITRGCKVLVQGITSTAYQCILTSGQVYVKLFKDIGFFVDIPSTNFVAQRTEKTSVGLLFDAFLDKDNKLYRNPHSGGTAFGSEGADRLIIKPTVVIDSISSPVLSGFYPVAILKPKSPNFVTIFNDQSDGRPDIFYYRNEELTQTFNERNLSSELKRVVDQTFHEMAGNFIAEGLYITFNESNTLVSVSPGVAYINGSRIESNFVNSYKLNYENPNASIESYSSENQIYIFYLTRLGEFGFVKQVATEIDLELLPVDSIHLGSVLFDGYGQTRAEPIYIVIEPKNRMPSVTDLILLEQQHQKNKKEVAQLVLLSDLYAVTTGINQNLNGIFADSFNDLFNSDISNPLFNCSIQPAIQAISLPFVSFPKDSSTIIINAENNPTVSTGTRQTNTGEEIPYWGTVGGEDVTYISQPFITTNIELIPFFPSSQTETLSAYSTPNIIYRSDRDTLVNYTDPKVKNLVYKNFVGQENNLERASEYSIDAIQIDGLANNNLIQNRTVTVEATGFPSYLDNITVRLNNDIVSNFIILDNIGSPGASFGAVKASVSGNIKISFLLPGETTKNTFTVQFSDGQYTATSQIVIEDPEINRVRRELTGRFIQRTPVRYSTVAAGIAQTFQVLEPTILSAVELFISDINTALVEGATSNADILTVHITRTIGGNNINTPTDESLAIGVLYRSNLNLPVNKANRLPSRITFDRPVILSEPGTYAIVIHSGIDQIQLGAAVAGQNDTRTGVSNSTQAVNVTGNLFIKTSANEWNSLNNHDLAFNLIQHRPTSITNTFNLSISNVETYNVLDINLPVELSDSSQLTVEVLDQGTYRPITAGTYFFPEPVNTSDIRVTTVGTSRTHPIIDLDTISINAISHSTRGSWISKNLEFATPYTNIDLAVDLYKPANAEFEIYISSDKGATWEELSNTDILGNQQYLVSVETVNDLLPLERYNYVKELTSFIQLNGQDTERFNLRVRVDINVTDLTNIPFFKNILAITY